jgi:hypothetical protein
MELGILDGSVCSRREQIKVSTERTCFGRMELSLTQDNTKAFKFAHAYNSCLLMLHCMNRIGFKTCLILLVSCHRRRISYRFCSVSVRPSLCTFQLQCHSPELYRINNCGSALKFFGCISKIVSNKFYATCALHKVHNNICHIRCVSLY